MKTLTSQAKMGRQSGFVLASELSLFSTVMVVGMTTGLTTMRDAATAEMEDVAEAIGSLDQSYAYSGLRSGHRSAVVDGSSFGDAVDRYAGDQTVFTILRNDYVEGSSGIPSSSAGRTAR